MVDGSNPVILCLRCPSRVYHGESSSCVASTLTFLAKYPPFVQETRSNVTPNCPPPQKGILGVQLALHARLAAQLVAIWAFDGTTYVLHLPSSVTPPLLKGGVGLGRVLRADGLTTEALRETEHTSSPKIQNTAKSSPREQNTLVVSLVREGTTATPSALKKALLVDGLSTKPGRKRARLPPPMNPTNKRGPVSSDCTTQF